MQSRSQFWISIANSATLSPSAKRILGFPWLLQIQPSTSPYRLKIRIPIPSPLTHRVRIRVQHTFSPLFMYPPRDIPSPDLLFPSDSSYVNRTGIRLPPFYICEPEHLVSGGKERQKEKREEIRRGRGIVVTSGLNNRRNTQVRPWGALGYDWRESITEFKTLVQWALTTGHLHSILCRTKIAFVT